MLLFQACSYGSRVPELESLVITKVLHMKSCFIVQPKLSNEDKTIDYELKPSAGTAFSQRDFSSSPVNLSTTWLMPVNMVVSPLAP